MGSLLRLLRLIAKSDSIVKRKRITPITKPSRSPSKEGRIGKATETPIKRHVAKRQLVRVL